MRPSRFSPGVSDVSSPVGAAIRPPGVARDLKQVSPPAKIQARYSVAHRIVGDQRPLASLMSGRSGRYTSHELPAGPHAESAFAHHRRSALRKLQPYRSAAKCAAVGTGDCHGARSPFQHLINLTVKSALPATINFRAAGTHRITFQRVPVGPCCRPVSVRTYQNCFVDAQASTRAS